MTETLDYPFGGWKHVRARRWTNPDGSNGGIVAVDARLHHDLVIPADAIVWPCASIGKGAHIGNDARIGYDARIGKGDWWMTSGPCSSRYAFWTAVWTAKYGLRWWVGCKHAVTTERLLELVAETHGNNDYAADYRAAIAYVESHPGLTRARAQRPPEGSCHG